MTDKRNPWLGLVSYQDPQKCDQPQSFRGRDRAINSILSMVHNNLLITIYGKTGIGKTSILNAGLFPLLRRQNYLPVLVRLGNIDNKKGVSFARHIVNSIFDEIAEIGGEVISDHKHLVDGNSMSTDYLWQFFCTTTFFNENGEEIFPVIVIDQLEEVFISQNEEAGVLMKQIYAVIDDNKAIPQKEGYSDNTNFRFVLSIREDDLFYLEDCIDRFSLPDMKENRYRLSPLEDSEAAEIVLLGDAYLQEGEKEEIVKKVIKLSKDEYGRISTNILSLLCSELFLQSDGNITLNLVSDSRKDPLVSFYKKCMSKVSESTRKYIEQNFVDEDRRKFISTQKFKKEVPSQDVDTLMDGECKILQNVTAGNTNCVELIHDSLARTIYLIKTDEKEAEKARKLQKHNKTIKAALFSLASVLIVLICGTVYWYIKSHNERGMGIPQQFVLSIAEDSLVIVDNDFWKAQLQIYAIDANNETTIVLDTLINKSQVNNTYTFSSDSSKKFRVLMEFNSSMPYENIDDVYSIGQLTDDPRILLKVKLKEISLITYEGLVTMNCNGITKNIQDAIVIFKDKIQRTNEKGKFYLNVEDSLNNGDAIFILKDGFTLLNYTITEEYGFQDTYVLTPSDSLTSFYARCSHMDSISHQQGWQYTAWRTPVHFTDGTSDMLCFYGKYLGLSTDGSRYKIEGFYYFCSEYSNQNPRPSYHIFTGWIDKDKLKTDRRFEVVSFDAANNRQTIDGLRSSESSKSGSRMSGKIYNSSGQIGVFGAD